MSLNNGVSSDVVATFADLPSAWARRIGAIGFVGSQGYAVESVAGVLTWVPTGGGSSTVTQQIVGAGAQSVNADVDVVTVDPGGGATVLTIPTLASRTLGRRLQIIQVGPGTVAIVGADPIFAGTSAYIMARVNDAVALSPQTGGWRLVAQIGAPLTFEVWVSSAGDDENVGTLASPLATLTEAINRAAKTKWYTTAQIRALGASLAWPSISIPAGLGSESGLLEFIGDTVVVATGTVTSVAAGTVRSTMVVTQLGAGWTPSAFRGAVGRFTIGGVLTDVGIFDNDADDLTTFRFVGATPAPGSTFDILQNVTTLTGFSLINPGTGFRVKFNRVNISGGTIAQECFVEFERVLFNVTSFGFFEQNCDVFAGVSAFGVLFSSAFSTAVNVGSMKVNGLGLHNISLQVFKDNATVTGGLASGTARFNVMATADIRGLYCNGSTLALGTNFIESSGAYVFLLNATINNVAGDAAICAKNGRITMTGVQGTGNASPCVRAESGSSIKVTDPGGAGTTITAGGADVKVGANAAVNWGAIATGLAVSTTDLASLSSQMCRVGV